jgi:transcriptional regulator with XRE-family HTH domain
MKRRYEDKIDHERFGKNLKAIMKEKDVIQKELAYGVGTSQGVVSLWVNGKKVPYAKNLVLIARFLEVSIDRLLEGVVLDEIQN